MQRLRCDFTLSALAEALEVSPSGFHAHGRKEHRPRRQEDSVLVPLLEECFHRSRRTYGCRRLRVELQAQGRACSPRRIRRLMRQAGLHARQKGRWRPQTTDSAHQHPIAQNWLSRLPSPDRPGRIWQSDITYIPTAEGFLYLAFVLDSASRRVCGHACAERIDTDLVGRAFTQAVVHQSPPAGLVHHSDRGSQYAAAAFQQLLRHHGVTPSMSRRANPYDNALAESFVATLKSECFQGSLPATRAQAQLQIFEYLEVFYNRHRRHSALGYRSPAAFERDLNANSTEGCAGGGRRRGETGPNSPVGSSRGGGQQLLGGVVPASGDNPEKSPPPQK